MWRTISRDSNASGLMSLTRVFKIQQLIGSTVCLWSADSSNQTNEQDRRHHVSLLARRYVLLIGLWRKSVWKALCFVLMSRHCCFCFQIQRSVAPRCCQHLSHAHSISEATPTVPQRAPIGPAVWRSGPTRSQRHFCLFLLWPFRRKKKSVPLNKCIKYKNQQLQGGTVKWGMLGNKHKPIKMNRWLFKCFWPALSRCDWCIVGFSSHTGQEMYKVFFLFFFPALISETSSDRSWTFLCLTFCFFFVGADERLLQHRENGSVYYFEFFEK